MTMVAGSKDLSQEPRRSARMVSLTLGSQPARCKVTLSSKKQLVSNKRVQPGMNKRMSGPLFSTDTGKQSSGTEPSSPIEISMDERIIFLEPEKISGNITKHQLVVAKMLKDAEVTYKEISELGRFRFKVILDSMEAYESIQKIDLTKHNLKIFQPKSTTETVAFVRGIPVDFDEKDVLDNIECDFEVTKVERIKRKRKENLVPTENMKITVQGGKVPEKVIIYGCPFKAEMYVYPVKQCFKCWKFGHLK
ncbi:uncharacterized protein LOC129754900 [Uranotaenia lowii]|uniref:uncharacterized protein LOC129754900 n=1 Tax=Uranotaenia lowii TaxID=190385 RepID=UPI002479F736|nr:uncharacterized protein LOC129754900 [Uranotaenia lowii]